MVRDLDRLEDMPSVLNQGTPTYVGLITKLVDNVVRLMLLRCYVAVRVTCHVRASVVYEAKS